MREGLTLRRGGASEAVDLTGLRWAAFGFGCLLAVLAVSGVLDSTLFTHPTTIKYAVTVLGSVLLALAALARAPLKLLVGVAIVLAPVDFVAVVQGMQVTPLLAVDLLAALVWLPRSGFGGKSALRPMTVAFVLLLVPALAGSAALGTWTLWLAVTVATGCLTFVVAREPGGPSFVATMLALSALIQGALAIWEFRTGQRLNLYQSSGVVANTRDYFFTYGREARPPGALPDPIGLGQVLALCVPMMVALAASMRRWEKSVAVLVATGVVGVALLLSLSRISFVGAAAGLVVTLALLPRRYRPAMFIGVAAMVAITAALSFGLAGSSLSRRIDSIFHPTAAHVTTASGDLTRLRIWNAALQTADAHLLAGVGLGNIANYLPTYGVPVTPSAHAHNTYLQFFAEGGVLGLLALLGLIAASTIDLVRGFAARRTWVAGAAGALVATLIVWSTDVEVRYVQVSAMVAVLLGLIAALAVQERPVSA